jgi:ABC-2 type transport system ATP-binding protein
MNPVIRTRGLVKRYGRRQALSEVSLTVPEGRVVGLVGPNGAGKSTLLKLAAGLLSPTAGQIEVLGNRPDARHGQRQQLAKVGMVAQEAPVYAGLSVADHLKLGRRLNPAWNDELAQRRIRQLSLDPGQKAGRLSGGQRAQLALTLAVAKSPELLLLDEPVAALDPLARRAFLQHLMETVAEQETSVVLSSHLVSDLERVCDYLIVLTASRVRLAGDVDELLSAHHRLVCARRKASELPAGLTVIDQEHTERQSTFVVRADEPLPAGDWESSALDLEDLVLIYMAEQPAGTLPEVGAVPLSDDASEADVAHSKGATR